MATKKLDSTGLSQVWAKIVENFATKKIAEAIEEKIPSGALASLDTVDTANLSDDLKSVINGKATSATTLEGYGIKDAYTQTETDDAIKAAVAGVYKVKGTVAFADLPETAQTGDVYNVSDGFDTTDSFAEGAGLSYPAGTNVVYTADGKWDCMAGTYDFSDYVKTSDIVDITSDEIDEICVISE